MLALLIYYHLITYSQSMCDTDFKIMQWYNDSGIQPSSSVNEVRIQYKTGLPNEEGMRRK